jgi:hypothetical protein
MRQISNKSTQLFPAGAVDARAVGPSSASNSRGGSGMRTRQIRVGQSLRQVQQFLDAHAGVVGPANESEARQSLNAAVTQLDASATEQGTRTRERHGEVTRREQLEQQLVRKFMTPVAKLARSRLQGEPNLAALTPSGSALQRERLVQSARSMIEAATPYAERFGAARFPADFLAQFTQAVDAVAASLQTRDAKHRDRVGATKSVQTALQHGRAAVAELDALVSHLILGNGRLEEEWRVAKRVTLSTGTRSKPTVPATPAPASTAAVS